MHLIQGCFFNLSLFYFRVFLEHFQRFLKGSLTSANDGHFSQDFMELQVFGDRTFVKSFVGPRCNHMLVNENASRLPDRAFHNFRASKYVDGQTLIFLELRSTDFCERVGRVSI